MSDQQVGLILIASGTGSDAYSIMRAQRDGQIPEVRDIVLVSTHAGAGCLDRATSLGVKKITLIPPSIPFTPVGSEMYKGSLLEVAKEHGSELCFLVGCRYILPVIPGVLMFNIHPAHPGWHGGKNMHSLAVHEHVLAMAVDELQRGTKKLGHSQFLTYPTVHEVTPIVDGGLPLLQGSVEIPEHLLIGLLGGTISYQAAAKKLQEVVLPYEHMMLPAAVRMAASRILASR